VHFETGESAPSIEADSIGGADLDRGVDLGFHGSLGLGVAAWWPLSEYYRRTDRWLACRLQFLTTASIEAVKVTQAPRPVTVAGANHGSVVAGVKRTGTAELQS